MAFRSLFTKHKSPHFFFRHLLYSKPRNLQPFCSHAVQCRDPPLSELVSEISRVLSDRRKPHHDLERSLNAFSSQISTSLVEQVLKRCKNLDFSPHKFFLWAKRIPGFEHSIESYHILVDILGSKKRFALLWDLLIDMRDSQCCELTPKIFWIIFRAYSRANLPHDAIRAYDRMVEFGIKPEIDDLDQLLITLCKRKHVRHAHEFFDKVKDDFEANVKIYSILIKGWGDIGDANEAQKLFDEMLDRGCSIDVLAYNSYLHALCKGGNVDEAYKMFRDMGSRGLNPDAWTYSIFIIAYCAMNDIHSVFTLLDRMKRYNLVPNVFTFNCIIKKLCENKKVEEAYQLVDEMIERGVKPDIWTYNEIQAYHCDHCEVKRALKLLSRMVDEKCLPDRHTYNMVLKLLITIGRFDKLAEVWDGMGEKGFYPSISTYSVMVRELCKKKGKLEEALKYFEMMIDEGIPPSPSTVEMLRNKLVDLGLLEQIEIIACKMDRSTACLIQELANTMRGNKLIKHKK